MPSPADSSSSPRAFTDAQSLNDHFKALQKNYDDLIKDAWRHATAQMPGTDPTRLELCKAAKSAIQAAQLLDTFLGLAEDRLKQSWVWSAFARATLLQTEAYEDAACHLAVLGRFATPTQQQGSTDVEGAAELFARSQAIAEAYVRAHSRAAASFSTVEGSAINAARAQDTSLEGSSHVLESRHDRDAHCAIF